ncbi:MAG: hypothetical protein HGA79_10190, partial [Anaerolineales bacterium]|nr:hypothetical protein [Anaerolineales bacterium]
SAAVLGGGDAAESVLIMTLVAMILSIVLGAASLGYGYSQEGYTAYAFWIVLTGIVWLLAEWRRLYWFASVALLLVIFAAGYGVWQEFALAWMFLGALGGLLGWDLSDFARRLRYAAPTDNIQEMERRHLARVGIVAALGLGLAYLSTLLQVRRLAFEVAVGLILLAAFGLARLVMRLRRY